MNWMYLFCVAAVYSFSIWLLIRATDIYTKAPDMQKHLMLIAILVPLIIAIIVGLGGH